jgi:PQQ-like domain
VARLLALSLKDGTVRWDSVLTKQSGSDVFGSPTYWRGVVYMGTSGPNGDQSTARGSVVALDEASGQVRWQSYTVPPGNDGGAVWSTPAIDTTTGRLYVGTGNAYHPPIADTTDSMMVLDSASGRILGHYQATSGDSFDRQNNPLGADADFGASPNLLAGPSGQPLVGEGAKNGTYWALDRATMKPVWNTTVGPGSTIGGILASTAYDGARIYGTDAVDGQLWALGPGEATQWASVDGGTADFSPVAIANGVLYSAAPGGFLTARDSATGTVLNRLSLGGPTFGGISVVGGAIYAAVGTGPPPQPAPQSDQPGSIVAFGDTSRSGAQSSPGGPRSGNPPRVSRHPMARIRLSVSPDLVLAGHRTMFRFHATLGSRPLVGAIVRLGRHRARTGKHGYATITARLSRGIHRARATARRLRSATATIRARAGDRHRT